MSATVVLDGLVLREETFPLHVLGGGLQYGEGLFETLPVLKGEPCLLERHVERLSSSAECLGFGRGPEEDTWRDDLARLVEARDRKDLAARLFLLRDQGSVRRVVVATSLPSDAREPVPIGLAASAFQGPRPLARMKTTSSLLARLALLDGNRRGLEEVVLTLQDGTVLEGAYSNVFIVSEGVLRTPPLDLPILPGITRAVVLELARTLGIPVEERAPIWEDMVTADEVFLTSSLRGVRAARVKEECSSTTRSGPITRALQKDYTECLPCGPP